VEGFEVGFHGEYREIVPNELIVCTEVFEGAAESEPAVCTYTFTQKNGRTTVTLVIELASKETRERDHQLRNGEGYGRRAGDIVERIAASLR